MEIDFLWTFATAWKLKLLVLMILAQIGLTIWLYGQMSKARVAAVKAGTVKPEDFLVVGDKPEPTAIFMRAVANQFELPVLFYVVILTGITIGVSSWLTVILAFLFVLSRIVHAREMIGENHVFTRRKLFINSVRIFLVLMAELFFSTLFFLQV